MNEPERATARVRDLVIGLVPVLLLTAAALLIFLVRQVYGPGRSEEVALYAAAGLPVIGAVLAGWTPWLLTLDGLGLRGDRLPVQVIRSALAFTVLSLIAWVGPWFVVRRVVDLASPFESMKWILAAGIIIQGLAFRAVLSRRRVPVWMGVVYWIACALIGMALWNRVAGLFA